MTKEEVLEKGLEIIKVGDVSGDITNSYDFAKKHGKTHSHVTRKITSLLKEYEELQVTVSVYLLGEKRINKLYSFSHNFSEWLLKQYKPHIWTREMIEEYIGIHKPMFKLSLKKIDEKRRYEFICQKEECGHVWLCTFDDFKRNTTGCPLCNRRVVPTVEKMNEMLEGRSIRVIEKIKKNTKNVSMVCLVPGCDHTWDAIWWAINVSGEGCGECGGTRLLTPEELNERVKNRPLVLVNKERNSCEETLHWKCLVEGCNCVWSAPWNNISSGHGCPLCAKRLNMACNSIRYKEVLPEEINKVLKNMEGTLYIINCYSEIEDFFKIGITGKTIDRRFSSKANFSYKYTTLQKVSGNLYDIIQAEYDLHNLHSTCEYNPDKYFDGYTECFTEINWEIIEKYLTEKGLYYIKQP